MMIEDMIEEDGNTSGSDSILVARGSIFVYFDGTNKYKAAFYENVYYAPKEDEEHDDGSYKATTKGALEVLGEMMKNSEHHYEFERTFWSNTKNSENWKELFHVPLRKVNRTHIDDNIDKFIENITTSLEGNGTPYIKIHHRTRYNYRLQFIIPTEFYSYIKKLANNFRKSNGVKLIRLN